MKLAVFSEDKVICSEGRYFSPNPLTRIYGRLADMLDVVVSGPVATYEAGSGVSGWSETAVSYSPRPYYGGSVVGFFRSFHRIIIPTLSNINRNIKEADIVMVRVPSAVGFYAMMTARWHRKKRFLYIAGDVLEVVSKGEKYRGLGRVAAVLAAVFFDTLTRAMARGTLVFTTGSRLMSRFGKKAGRCVNMIPSLVSEQDIFYRTDACKSRPVRLLYVGRLIPVKGVAYLLDALAILKGRGLDVNLEIAGDGPNRPSIEEYAKRLGLKAHVTFSGRIPFGPRLFELYRRSDIFVLPSLSEGIPKVLIEAMASGLPVVATRVGSVCDVVCDGQNGLLVLPRSPESIADAVFDIVENREKRERIIKNGYEFVRNHTIERQADMMWQEICSFFGLEGS